MKRTPAKSKTTFRISPEVLDTFQHYIEALGLRRDKYLNMVLPTAISWLRMAKTNSQTAERLWKSMRDVRDNSFQKVAVLLDAKILSDLNSACAEKRVPRDQFFQTFLECLVNLPENGNGPAPLPSALSLIENPWEQWYGIKDETPFDHIIMADLNEGDLDDLLQSVRAGRKA